MDAVRASHYYRKGQVEIDAVLHGGETAVEVKHSPDARDALKLSRAAASLGARRKMIVASSDSRQLKGVEVVPAYALEWKMEEKN